MKAGGGIASAMCWYKVMIRNYNHEAESCRRSGIRLRCRPFSWDVSLLLFSIVLGVDSV